MTPLGQVVTAAPVQSAVGVTRTHSATGQSRLTCVAASSEHMLHDLQTQRIIVDHHDFQSAEKVVPAVSSRATLAAHPCLCTSLACCWQMLALLGRCGWARWPNRRRVSTSSLGCEKFDRLLCHNGQQHVVSYVGMITTHAAVCSKVNLYGVCGRTRSCSSSFDLQRDSDCKLFRLIAGRARSRPT